MPSWTYKKIEIDSVESHLATVVFIDCGVTLDGWTIQGVPAAS
jgi:hypothetical protein